MLVAPEPRNDSGHFMSDLRPSRSGGVLSLMSECMSVTSRSSRPSLFMSKTFTPIEPQDVRGNTSRLRFTKRCPPTFS